LYGGYYTQDEIRDVVQYAAIRGIDVIPEIDMPGHNGSACWCYRWLSCTQDGREPLCLGRQTTIEFAEKVYDEVFKLFPYEYVSIGGDEVNRRRWSECNECKKRIEREGLKDVSELQAWFTKRMEKYFNAHGRRILGWDEILEGELAPGATVMSWRGVKGGIQASSKGFDVIMTPNSYLYIDYYQSHERDKEPFAIGGYLPLEKVYSYEPMEGMAEGAEDHILGVQCNLWTEYIATPEHLEYMLLPRMCAVSEINWSDASDKDFDRFNAALDHSFEIMDALGYTYCKDIRGIIGLPVKEQ
jgi:hexosaminidase